MFCICLCLFYVFFCPFIRCKFISLLCIIYQSFSLYICLSIIYLSFISLYLFISNLSIIYLSFIYHSLSLFTYLPFAVREKQKRDKRNVGDIKPKRAQWLMGCSFVIGIVLLLWFPLIILALPGATIGNPPKAVTVSLRT